MSAAQNLDIDQPFDPAERAFRALTETLGAPKALRLSHSAFEGLVESEGREVLRLLFQRHLELRGPGDVGPSVVGSDGVDGRRSESAHAAWLRSSAW